MKPRVVFDCVVFVQAIGSPRGPAGACFDLVRSGQFELALSDDVLSEWREVLARPSITAKFPHVQSAGVEPLLDSVIRISHLIHQPPTVYELDRDHKDEPYLNLAAAANAQYLITRDRDLLDLNNDSDFQKRPHSFSILDPVAFLREVAAKPA